MIGIVGLGTVGTAIAQALLNRHPMLHCDPGQPDTVPLERLAAECSLIFVCVPTPPSPSGAADTSIVGAVVAALAEAAGETPPLVVIKSTVPPGTTEALAQAHAKLPLVVCPEFLRHAHAAQDLATVNRVLIGVPQREPSLDQLNLLRGVLREIAPLAGALTTTASTAEMVKHGTNAFLALKVTFANQMADACAAMGVDYPAFTHLLALDPRIADSHLQVPGPDGARGFGGSCLPKDLEALVQACEPHLPLLRAAADWNTLLRGTDE